MGIAQRRQSPETELHRAVVAHLETRGVPGLLWFHVPNGGLRTVRGAVALKRLGTKAGVADLLLFYDGDHFALELKAPGKKARPSQQEFLEDWRLSGGHAICSSNLDESISWLEGWGLLLGCAY